jgi:hypothetical protein
MSAQSILLVGALVFIIVSLIRYAFEIGEESKD